MTNNLRPFPCKLIYENVDGERIRLVRDFIYDRGNGEVFRVPSGFVCDGMSYPVRSVIALLIVVGIIAGANQSFLWLGLAAGALLIVLLGVDITPQGKGVKAGVIHDYLYSLAGQPVPDNGRCYGRKQADLVFKSALEDSGVNLASRLVRYWGLRFGGWVAWNQHARRVQQQQQHQTKGCSK